MHLTVCEAGVRRRRMRTFRARPCRHRLGSADWIRQESLRGAATSVMPRTSGTTGRRAGQHDDRGRLPTGPGRGARDHPGLCHGPRAKMPSASHDRLHGSVPPPRGDDLRALVVVAYGRAVVGCPQRPRAPFGSPRRFGCLRAFRARACSHSRCQRHVPAPRPASQPPCVRVVIVHFRLLPGKASSEPWPPPPARNARTRTR